MSLILWKKPYRLFGQPNTLLRCQYSRKRRLKVGRSSRAQLGLQNNIEIQMRTQYDFLPTWLVKMKELNNIQVGKDREKDIVRIWKTQALLCSLRWWEYKLAETLERAMWHRVSICKVHILFCSNSISKICIKKLTGQVHKDAWCAVWFSAAFIFFLRFYLFLDRGEGREKEKERNIDQLPLTHTPNRGLAYNPGMCPDWESNWWPFSLQDDAQPTEPNQPGQFTVAFNSQTNK